MLEDIPPKEVLTSPEGAHYFSIWVTPGAEGPLGCNREKADIEYARG